MPVEVIDLLSSPDAPPSRSKAARMSSIKAPSRALEYRSSDDDDFIDMTGDAFRSASAQPKVAAATVSGPKRPSSPGYAAFRFDDDNPFDDSNYDKPPNIGKSMQQNKRQRLDNADGSKISRGPRRSSAAENAAKAALSRHTSKSANVTNSLLSDPIQTSSDPFSPHKPQRQTVVDLCSDIDDNPFASSPPPVGGSKAASVKVNRARLPSSPIFASSQPQRSIMASPSRSKDPTGKGKVKGKGKADDAWDRISSSAPEPDLGHSRKESRPGTKTFDLGDLATYEFDSDDSDELPDFDALRRSKASSGRAKPAASKGAPNKSAAEKELERLDKAAAKEADRRRKQEEKDAAKQQRAREKERAAALAEVNKVRTDKKVSTPEMIAVIPNSLKPALRLQIETLLEDLSVKCESYHSPVNNAIKWRRKVKARFNEEDGQWEPIAERVENDNHAMVIVTAPEFVELALGINGSNLEAHVLQMQRHFDGYTLIYLIEGLTPWMRKNRNVRNQQFQSAVRSAGSVHTEPDAPPPSGQRRKKDPKPPPSYIDEDALEDALLQLQVQHGVLIHHTAAAVETAQWVAVFTQHISTVPYRRQKDAANSSAAFCMESGQVRTGDGPKDTYVRMLQEIIRITPAIAHGIAGEFGTVTDLVRGLETEGPLALEGIRKSANRDGAYSDRNIGQAISRRVWKVFTGRDERSTDI